MNLYQRTLNITTKEAEANHCMCIKIKYRPKWLPGGTPSSHPVHVAYEKEFDEFSYRAIRKIVKKNYKDIESLKKLRKYLDQDNRIKWEALWPGVKYGED